MEDINSLVNMKSQQSDIKSVVFSAVCGGISKLLFNEMCSHKPHAKTKKRTLIKKSNFNSPHRTVNNLNIFYL